MIPKSCTFSIAAVLTLLAAPPGPISAQQTSTGTPNLPRFTRSLLLETGSDTSANVSIGDLNGDGQLDILLVKGRHWPGMSRVFLGDGQGRFPTAYDLGDTRYRSYSGRLVDMDGDGDLDVVLSNDAPDPKLILLNDGHGRFQAGSTFGRPVWPTRNVGIADLNGDGLTDIVVANRAEDAIAYLCLNQGAGRFTADCTRLAPVSTTTITPTDLNRDGLTDLVVPHRDGGQSYVYLNKGKATFPSTAAMPFGPRDAAIRMAEIADFDHDGLPDIVAIDENQGAAIYFGRTGTFSPALALEDGKVTPYALAVADLNHDGFPDIVVGHVEAASTIYFNTGSGRRYTTLAMGDNKGAAYGFAIADLDGDGLLDIAVARSEAPSLVFFADTAAAPPQ